MKILFHRCPNSFVNCYVLGNRNEDKGTSDAVIIDPAFIDSTIIRFIEDNNFKLRGILITHAHLNHVRGLRTLKRIYDVDIYAMNRVILDQECVLIRDMDIFYAGPFRFEVISVPGHSLDSVVFKIEHLLFTGDVISAGLVGLTASTYGAKTQMNALRNKVLSLPGDFIILPGHGPPSSLEAERRFNSEIQYYENKHPEFL